LKYIIGGERMIYSDIFVVIQVLESLLTDIGIPEEFHRQWFEGSWDNEWS
jgi:hypothetical protein